MASPREVARRLMLFWRIISLLLMIQSTYSQSETSFSCYRITQVSANGKWLFQSNTMGECQAGFRCLLVQANGTMLIENERAPALMVFGECLPSFMCETECKLLFSSAQASLPYTIDFNSCNSTCCDTDLCNRYGPENITVPDYSNLYPGIITDTSDSTSETSFSCYRTIQVNTNGIPIYQTNDVMPCQEGFSCTLMEVNATMLIANQQSNFNRDPSIDPTVQTSSSHVVVGECLPTYACSAQCKHLDSSGLTALPYEMEVNSCNSTCCDTDLCNKYGSGNATAPDDFNFNPGIIADTSDRTSETSFSCYQTIQVNANGIPTYQTNNVISCQEGFSCTLMEVNATMLIENQPTSAHVIVGVCLPTYACDAQCKHLDSSGLTALPFKMEVNSCNSTCCDTDLCNKYGSGNITVPDYYSVLYDTAHTSDNSDQDNLNGGHEAGNAISADESTRTCGDTTLQTWLGLTHTIDHAWIDGVFTNFTCEWQISAIPGYIVQLTVVAFETKSCCENVTLIDQIQNSVLYVLNGTIDAGTKYFSNSNLLRIKFMSSLSYSQSRFTFVYTATHYSNLDYEVTDTSYNNSVPARTCGDTSLETWPGLVSTINYAWVDGVFSNYACEWQINALPGYIVQLTVVAFETQACCENVTLIDPTRNNALYVLNGSIDAGTVYFSNSSLLRIKFMSGLSYSQSRFTFVYTATDNYASEEISQDNPSPKCCSALNATSEPQTLTSTNFPSSYPSNQRCGWVLLAPEGFHVKIRANLVDVEFCCDHLEVSEPSSTPFVFETGNTYISEENILLINFSSDGDIQLKGFQITYQAVRSSPKTQDPCREREHRALVGVEQYFNSPDYPNKYSNNLTCLYTFLAPNSSYRIRYHFEFFDTENCCDRLYVYDSVAEDGQGIWMSGVNDKKVRYSNFSTLMIRFTSDASVTRKGFILVYTAVAESEVPTQAAQSDSQTTANVIFEAGSPVDSTSPSVPSVPSNFNTIDFSHLWREYRRSAEPCTFDFVATSVIGFLYSPNWPSRYDPNVNCIWVLRARPGKHVQLSFIEYELESCCDYVTVNNGITETNRLNEENILRMSPFYSNKNVLILKFRSDGSVQYRGFKAEYVEVDRIPEPSVPNRGVCGFNATASNISALLYSPGWPNPYSPGLNCTWILSAPEGSQVNITFQQFDTEFCCDYLLIFDGEEKIADLKGEMHTFPTLNSRSGQLTLFFHSDFSFQRVGFEAKFAIAGSEETDENLVDTKKGISCYTGIRLSGSNLHQDSYALTECSPESGCMDVEASVVLGTSTKANLSFSQCIPQIECSTFSCDQVRGLLPPYAAASFHLCTIRCCNEDKCNDPKSRLDKITDEQFDQVVTDRKTTFKPESEKTKTATKSPTTATITEKSKEYVTKNVIEITTAEKLVATNSSQATTSKYERLDDEITTATLPPPSTTAKFRTPAPCGFHARATNVSQNLFSPGWPSSYKPNLNCDWVLEAQRGKQIRLTFVFLDTEWCCDHLEIIDEGGPPIDRIGGTGLPRKSTFISSNGVFLIRFVSDNDQQGKGFRLTFEDMDSEVIALAPCGFTTDATNVNQPLNSPGFPREYERNKDCVWNINARSGQQIQVNFTNFETERCCDYVKIYEDEVEMLYLRGSIDFESYVTKSSKMKVVFHSDPSMQYPGFQASFRALGEASTDSPTETSTVRLSSSPSTTASDPSIIFDPIQPRNTQAITAAIADKLSATAQSTTPKLPITPAPCGSILKAKKDPQEFYSPGWPGDYGRNLNCEWRIHSANGKHVQLTFSMIDIELCCDLLEVFDNDYRFALIKSVPENPYISYSSTLIVRFQSDNVVQGTGFKAAYREVENPPAITKGACGFVTVVSAKPQMMFSPGWPKRYPPRTDCVWALYSSTPGKQVAVEFTMIDIEACCDHLTIREQGVILARLKGRRLPSNPYRITSSYGSLNIRFYSDFSINKRGFKAIFYETSNTTLTDTAADSTTKTSILLEAQKTLGTSAAEEFVYHPSQALSDPEKSEPTAPSEALVRMSKAATTSKALVAAITRLKPTAASSTSATKPPKMIVMPSTTASTISTKHTSASDPFSSRQTMIVNTSSTRTKTTVALLSSSSSSTTMSSTAAQPNVEVRTASLNAFFPTTTATAPTSKSSTGKVPAQTTSTLLTSASSTTTLATPQSNRAANVRTSTAQSSTSTGQPIASAPTSTAKSSSSGLPVASASAQRIVATTASTAKPSSAESFFQPIFTTATNYVESSSVSAAAATELALLSCSERTYLRSPARIQTPNFPKNYPNNNRCTWIVDAGIGKQVAFSVIHFEIEECCDYVELLDGEESRRIVRLNKNINTGHVLYISTTNLMKIVFYSDSSDTASGLKAIVSSRTASALSPGACGFTAFASENEVYFHSPNYPNEYPSHSNCYWLIKSREKDRQIDLNLIDVGLEADHDFLTIYDGSNSSSALLTSLHDMSDGNNFQSSSGSLFLHFRSDATKHYRGFNASFRLASLVATTEQKEECLIGVKMRGGEMDQDTRSQSFCGKGYGCSVTRARFRVEQGGLFLPVLVYLGQCLPVDQCHAVSCNDIISSLPSTFKNNMESCRAECCGEGKCSGSAIGGSIGDIDEDEDTRGLSSLQCHNGIYVNGKRISKTIPETAFCELGSVCFVVDSLITTDEFGNDITPAISSVAQCVDTSRCEENTCDEVIRQARGRFSRNITSCSARCCNESLCNAPDSAPPTEEMTTTTPRNSITSNKNFTCPGNDLYFLPGCTFKEYQSQAWICSTLFFNDFPYTEPSTCGDNLRLYDSCIIGLKNKCMSGNKSSLLGDEMVLTDDIKDSVSNFYKNLTMILHPSYEVFCEKIWVERTNLPGGLIQAVASFEGSSAVTICDAERVEEFERRFYEHLRALIGATNAQEFCSFYKSLTYLSSELLDNCDLSLFSSSSLSHWSQKLRTKYPRMLRQMIIPKCLALQTIEELLPSNPTLASSINFTSPDSRGCWSYTIDLMFLVDGSGSIRAGEFPLVIDFVKQITAFLDLESHKVGVMQYSHWYRNKPDSGQRFMDTEIELGQFTSHADFNEAADSIDHHGYTTFTARAIKYSIDYNFAASERFNDQCTRKVMIVITDGRSSDASSLESSSSYARNNNVTVIAVGIRGYRLQELQVIANGEEGNNRLVHTASKFFQLVELVPIIREELAKMIRNGSANDEADSSSERIIDVINF